MIPRPLLTCLVFALPILLVVFAVASGGFLLFAGSNDAVIANGLWLIAVVLIVLIVSDIILLVGCLGWMAYVDQLSKLDPTPSEPEQTGNTAPRQHQDTP